MNYGFFRSIFNLFYLSINFLKKFNVKNNCYNNLSFFYIFSNFFLTKKNLLPNYSGDNHQRFFNKNKIQLSGGIFLIPIFSIVTYDYSIILTIFLFSIFLLGLFSDIGLFSSAKFRFITVYYYFFIFILLEFFINISENRFI